MLVTFGPNVSNLPAHRFKGFLSGVVSWLFVLVKEFDNLFLRSPVITDWTTTSSPTWYTTRQEFHHLLRLLFQIVLLILPSYLNI